MINLETNLDLSDMETSVLDCVNPYDINPIGEDKNIKLEMEEFSDLAPFLPKSMQMRSTTDELNTPIFERKGPFNFMLSDNASDINQQQDSAFTDFSVNIEDPNSNLVNLTLQNSDANLLFTTNDKNIFIINNNENETPINVQSSIFKIEQKEDSNSSAENAKPKLKLDLSINQSMVLNTPDVIDSVVDLETSFNILDYVNEKEVTTVNLEDFQFDSNPSTSSRPKRKRKYDDYDEDYQPDSDSEDELPKPKRGRPIARRTSSVSSDYSDATKYRELRDKNNEASRRSRLKRKMKELNLQKEADELYEKNVKLKAQVEEYEKMVNNFRSNLFKIMLKK